MSALGRVRVVIPYSGFRGAEGEIRHRYADGAVSVRLDGREPSRCMVFRADEVEELGACALCGADGLTEEEAADCGDCSFAGRTGGRAEGKTDGHTGEGS